mgnify:CR=1 FL=1
MNLWVISLSLSAPKMSAHTTASGGNGDFRARKPDQTKYTVVTSRFNTYEKRPRSRSESIVVAGDGFLISYIVRV